MTRRASPLYIKFTNFIDNNLLFKFLQRDHSYELTIEETVSEQHFKIVWAKVDKFSTK